MEFQETLITLVSCVQPHLKKSHRLKCILNLSVGIIRRRCAE